MPTWKRTLLVIWLAQFCALMGFSLGFPFIPFFFKELGVTEPDRLKIWIALFATVTPLSLAISSPIWGRLSDRFGRRIMLIRAQAAAAVIIGAMGLVHSPYTLIGLRTLQGLFTGTVTAAQSLVTSAAPPHRNGFALGMLSSSVFSGMTVGAALGGFLAHYFGYRVPFYIAGVLFTISALLVFFFVEEPPPVGETPSPRNIPPNYATQEEPVWSMPAREYTLRDLFHLMLPVLLLTVGMSFTRQVEIPFFPLFVEQILAGTASTEIWTGTLIALGGTAGFLSGIFMGRWSDRIGPERLALYSVMGAAICMVPHIFVQSIWTLIPLRFVTYFCVGGMDPVLQIWLARVTPPRRWGEAFGWLATARSLGWMLCPLPAGYLAASQGLRSLYIAGFLLYAFLLPCVLYVAKKSRRRSLSPRS